MRVQNTRLDRSFYRRSDVLQLASDLLGKVLVTEIDGSRCSGIIVETEAYKAPEDKASHAYGNKRTSRTEIMFGEGGFAYVYICYGIHYLFNIVTGGMDQAHAVLIRAIEPMENPNIMLERRKMIRIESRMTAGPGVLTKALGIDLKMNGMDLCAQDSQVWIEDMGNQVTDVVRSPRVGVDYAEECALWDWRFRVKGSQWTSKAK